MIDSRARFSLAALSMFVVLCTAAPSFAADDGTWSALTDAGTPPSPRRNYAAAYDRPGERYVVVAGEYGDLSGGYQLFNQVWTLSLDPNGSSQWAMETISGSQPGERHSPQWAFDAANNRLIVFGGYGRHHPGDPYAYLNDVWQLSMNGTTHWDELAPTGTAPSGRLAGTAIYDPMMQRLVGFGGTVGVPVDTWQLDLSGQPQWSTIQTQGQSPPGGWCMSSIFDPIRYRMIVFGGSIDDSYEGVRNDLWQLDLTTDPPTWTKLDPGGPLPVARRAHAAIYDPLRDRMIIYGGWDSGGENMANFLGDVWALNLDGDPQWTQLAPAGTTPIGRATDTGIYDPMNDRFVTFGAWNGQYMMNDTQFLSWGGQGDQAILTGSGSAVPNSVTLHWNVQHATGSRAGVYRRQTGSAWKSIGTTQNASFVDHAVTPGGHYDYMMVVPSERGDEFGGQVGVDVPATLGVGDVATSFALDRVSPNPATRHFTVSFALANASPATVELLDLGGRRVLSRDVGSFGAGKHQLELRTAGHLAPGMYFLRLTQSGRSLSSRVVIQGD